MQVSAGAAREAEVEKSGDGLLDVTKARAIQARGRFSWSPPYATKRAIGGHR